ncbi:hypothetical protein [Neobacillus niacini]|nr:hypothetical protein [Neobacillus niacini]
MAFQDDEVIEKLLSCAELESFKEYTMTDKENNKTI